MAFRRAMKRAVQTAIRMGAGGIRVNVGGRLGGADNRNGSTVSGPSAIVGTSFCSSVHSAPSRR